MEKSVLKRLLSHLGRHAFESFVVELFGSARKAERFEELAEAGEGVYYQPILDSYGGSLHSVFVLHHSPLELLNSPSMAAINDPILTQRVRKAGSAARRFCGPRLFGPTMERSNSCARIGGHPDVVDPVERDRRSNRSFSFVRRRSWPRIRASLIPQRGADLPRG
jgi:hypothetical protein